MRIAARRRVAEANRRDPSELVLSERDREELLALARVVAHGGGDRTKAPLVRYLAGVALDRNPDLVLAELIRDALGEQP